MKMQSQNIIRKLIEHEVILPRDSVPLFRLFPLLDIDYADPCRYREIDIDILGIRYDLSITGDVYGKCKGEHAKFNDGSIVFLIKDYKENILGIGSLKQYTHRTS